MANTPNMKMPNQYDTMIEKFKRLRTKHPSDPFYETELAKIIQHKSIIVDSSADQIIEESPRQIPYFEVFRTLRSHVGSRLLPWSKEDSAYYAQLHSKMYHILLIHLGRNLRDNIKWLAKLSRDLATLLIEDVRIY